MANLKARCIFDGKVCVLDEHSRCDFERVHRRPARCGNSPDFHHVACAFDLLVKGGPHIRGNRSTSDRTPAEIVDCCADTLLHRLSGRRRPAISAGLRLKLEGIVAKRAGSLHVTDRRDWVKVKRPDAVPPQRFRR